MSLKTENSRRVAKSRPVCMGLYSFVHVYGKKLTIFPCQKALFQSYSHARFWTNKKYFYDYGLALQTKLSGLA
jgi:hypothetical protein